MNNTPIKTPNNTSSAQVRPTSAEHVKRRRKRNTYKLLTLILTMLLAVSVVFNAVLLVAEINISNGPSTSSHSNVTDSGSQGSSATETDENTLPLRESEYEAEIALLRDMIKVYSDSAQQEFSEQMVLYNGLIEMLLMENRPIHNHKIVEYEDGEEEPKRLSTPAKVAFAYVDLASGYGISYNADEIMYSASLIKAPYIYSVLLMIEDFEYNKKNFASDGSALYSEDSTPLFEGAHPNLDENGKIIYLPGEEKFDLTRSWTYNSSTMFVEGSGIIQNKADGFTCTYLDLVKYALMYSDNIAFDILMDTFGRNSYNVLAEKLGISGATKGFMQLTANDCIIFMTEIYKYMETDSIYAATMKEAMLSAPYSTMITPAVDPYPCAHKYGWDIDSYHDMAIVYHDRPFALVILTDLDEGAAKDYTYIQRITKKVLELHDSFSKTDDKQISEPNITE